MMLSDDGDLEFNHNGASELMNAFDAGSKMRYLPQPCSPTIELLTDAETGDLRFFISKPPERLMRHNRLSR